MPLPADTFLNHYRVLRVVGAGGMGEVYEAEDTRLKRKVALKILPEELASDADRRARFQREAEALATLNHPNIVTIHSIEESAGTYFLTMELVDGRTLGEMIPKGGLKLSEFLKYAIPLADAISAAHDRGVIHSDLKPANVMVTAGGLVKVLDFGLARQKEPSSAALLAGQSTVTLTGPAALRVTADGRIFGSVAYMSPEQAEGKGVDFRSDVFSLGIMLYEMAAGVRPFRGDTSMAILSSVIKDTPQDLLEVNPAASRELARVVRRCLAKDPERRFQSAKELRNELEDLAQQVTADVAAAPAVRTQGFPRWAAAAAVVLFLAVGTYFALRQRLSDATPVVPTFTRLTSAPGIEAQPSLSPDGSWIVYSAGKEAGRDIYLQGIGGDAAISLTKDSPAYDGTPAFSPDGRRIAFRSDRDGGGIFVMGRLGESVQRLTTGGWDPSWTPDGREIVYGTESAFDPEARYAPGELWAVNVASGERRRISTSDAAQPRVSPDGKLVAFWALPVHENGKSFAGANRDIWIQPLAGGARVQVTSGESSDYSPAWSPDGRFLYFSSDRGGSVNLWRVAIERGTGRSRGDAQPMTTPALYAVCSDVSADGSTVAYTAYDFSTKIRSVGFDPTNGVVQGKPVDVVAGSRAWLHPDVSRDGRLLTLRSWRAQQDIWVVGVDGTGLRNLTHDPAPDRGSRFAGDGSILFYSSHGGDYQFWTINPDGSGQRQLTHVEHSLNYPLPSPDGKRVGGSDPNTREQYIFDADDFSKPPERLPSPPAKSAVYLRDWSPDGTRIAANEAPGSGVWIYHVAEKRWERIGEGAYPRWLPDGRRLLAVQEGRIILHDVQSKQMRDVYAEPDRNIGSLALSPDGRRLYFPSAIVEADIWLMRFGPGALR